jgi:hypothetical protein
MGSRGAESRAQPAAWLNTLAANKFCDRIKTSPLRAALCLAALVASSATVSRAAEIIPPAPAGYFNDFAGVISKEAAYRFNEQLAQFERETSNQVVVAVFPKMQSDSLIGDYTLRVVQSWGVGQKDRSNGVVLFVFIRDRKMFMQVGHGLEAALPNTTAFDITERHIKPLFRTGNYEAGLATGIYFICKTTRDAYKGSGKTVAEQLVMDCPAGEDEAVKSDTLRFKGFSLGMPLGCVVKLIKEKYSSVFGETKVNNVNARIASGLADDERKNLEAASAILNVLLRRAGVKDALGC